MGGVVVAAANYPDPPKAGDVITGLGSSLPMGTKIVQAGTKIDAHGNAVTSGGRVLCVCALGDDVGDAQQHAYKALSSIHWDGEFHRHDIGWRASERERAGP